MERNRYRMQEQESPFDSFARFLAPESHRALDLAREEMLALSHWWIGTEHLLWGLASEGSLASFLDRKSTRLNSSHQIISYAVFCLKKKKNQLVVFARRSANSTAPPPCGLP